MASERGPAVSVVSLTYNHAGYLAECIESVRAQSFTDWEQVILDDGSTDATSEVAAACADFRVRFFAQPHRGVAGLAESYRYALSLCRGRYVGFLDGDDVWAEDALAATQPALERGEAVLAFGRTERFGGALAGETVPGERLLARHPRDVLFNRPVGAAARPMLDAQTVMLGTLTATLVRRDVLARIGGLQSFPGLPVVDHPTLLRLSLEGPFHYADRTTAYRRIHGGAVTRSETPRILFGVYRSILAFRRRHGGRLGLTEEEWEALEAGWRARLSHYPLLRAGVELLRARRYAEAGRLGRWLALSPRVLLGQLGRLARGAG